MFFFFYVCAVVYPFLPMYLAYLIHLIFYYSFSFVVRLLCKKLKQKLV